MRTIQWDQMFDILVKKGDETGGDYNVTRRSVYTCSDGTCIKIGSWLGYIIVLTFFKLLKITVVRFFAQFQAPKI